MGKNQFLKAELKFTAWMPIAGQWRRTLYQFLSWMKGKGTHLLTVRFSGQGNKFLKKANQAIFPSKSQLRVLVPPIDASDILSLCLPVVKKAAL